MKIGGNTDMIWYSTKCSYGVFVVENILMPPFVNSGLQKQWS